MALGAAVGRIGATLVAMLHTRLELAAVEVQEEARRLSGYLAWTLMAVLLGAGAVLFAALFVVLLFWDSYRLAAVGAMAVLLALAGFVILNRVQASFAAKPALFEATRKELRNDLDFITGAGHASE
ncbi:phage holin family protein [Massilia agilis]|uniref:Phage holin family protein n=2 Tax=Massilia TaxID=149698 RepID=A0ABT2BQ63_9BURK|nr:MULTISPECIES: phage holin family protein [Massilia]MCS0610546.1 phage holin family protein [Massilia solisilvae]MCS0810018.1 phage holin family protein [Massilia agilis]